MIGFLGNRLLQNQIVPKFLLADCLEEGCQAAEKIPEWRAGTPSQRVKPKNRLTLYGDDLQVNSIPDFGADIQGWHKSNSHFHINHLADGIETCALVITQQFGFEAYAQFFYLLVEEVVFFHRQDLQTFQLRRRDCRFVCQRMLGTQYQVNRLSKQRHDSNGRIT